MPLIRDWQRKNVYNHDEVKKKELGNDNNNII